VPMLDVSAALTNPYTLDTFDVNRVQEIMNNYGEMTTNVQTFPGESGVVYPEGPEDLARRPEAELNAKTIVIITRFALRGMSSDSNDGKRYQPDIVTWRNDNYIVVRVEDWSNFASGFVKCTCSSTDMVDQSTRTI